MRPNSLVRSKGIAVSHADETGRIFTGLSDAGVEFIVVKAKAGRPKDRIVLPVLIATLEEQRRRQP
jgi:hypothetical protein